MKLHFLTKYMERFLLMAKTIWGYNQSTSMQKNKECTLSQIIETSNSDRGPLQLYYHALEYVYHKLWRCTMVIYNVYNRK